MVNSIKSDSNSRWLAYDLLAIPARALYNTFWAASSTAVPNYGSAGDVFNSTASPVSTALALTSGRVSQNNASLVESAARTASSARSFFSPPVVAGASYAIGSGAAESAFNAASGATGAASAAQGAAQGAFGAAASAFNAASGATQFIWNGLSWTSTLALGTLSLLTLAYLFNKYVRGNGVNVTQSNTNTNTVHLNIKLSSPGTKIVKTEKNGEVQITVEQEEPAKVMEPDECAEVMKKDQKTPKMSSHDQEVFAAIQRLLKGVKQGTT